MATCVAKKTCVNNNRTGQNCSKSNGKKSLLLKGLFDLLPKSPSLAMSTPVFTLLRLSVCHCRNCFALLWETSSRPGHCTQSKHLAQLYVVSLLSSRSSLIFLCQFRLSCCLSRAAATLECCACRTICQPRTERNWFARRLCG